MSIWNKVFMAMVFVASLIFLYMAMHTLKTMQYWREQVIYLEKQVEHREKIKEVLIRGGDLEIEGLAKKVVTPSGNVVVETTTLPEDVEGEKIPVDPDKPEATKDLVNVTIKDVCSIRQLEAEYRTVIYDRGQVWRGCSFASSEPSEPGRIKVMTASPVAGAIRAGTILHMFEESAFEADGRYIGEMIVTNVKAGQAAPAPAPAAPDDAGAGDDGAAAPAPAPSNAMGAAILTLRPVRMLPYHTELRQRIVDTVSKANAGDVSWVLYHSMPGDSDGLFTLEEVEALPKLYDRLSDDDLAQQLLADSGLAISEVIQRAEQGDPEAVALFDTIKMLVNDRPFRTEEELAQAGVQPLETDSVLVPYMYPPEPEEEPAPQPEPTTTDDRAAAEGQPAATEGDVAATEDAPATAEDATATQPAPDTPDATEDEPQADTEAEELPDRPLCDYNRAFAELEQRYLLLVDETAALSQDLKYALQAKGLSEQVVANHTRREAEWSARKTATVLEWQAAAEYNKTLGASVARLEADVQAMLAKNQADAQGISARYLYAKERIEKYLQARAGGQ